METFDNVFQTIMNSGVTKLKPQTRLASLLVYEGERDVKKRQKYTAVLEEMRTVSTTASSLMCVESSFPLAQLQVLQRVWSILLIGNFVSIGSCFVIRRYCFSIQSDQVFLQRVDFDTKGFTQRQINQYGRLVGVVQMSYRLCEGNLPCVAVYT